MRRLDLTALFLLTLSANGATLYNNLGYTNAMAVSSRPGGAVPEVEAADDFVFGTAAQITGASFIGLFVPNSPGGSTLPTEVGVEFYRVFPLDSDTTRTINVTTRVNSPSDVAFATRDSTGAGLSFLLTSLGSLSVINSVNNTGINPKPNQATGGAGPVTGTAVRFDVTFSSPVLLPADHYFFVPQVSVTNGQFYWLSASRPVSGAGSTPFTTDLQAWVRNAALDPDWSRVGTDIISGSTPPTFNMAFSLDGTTVPEPASIGMAAAAFLLLAARKLRQTY